MTKQKIYMLFVLVLAVVPMQCAEITESIEKTIFAAGSETGNETDNETDAIQFQGITLTMTDSNGNRVNKLNGTIIVSIDEYYQGTLVQQADTEEADNNTNPKRGRAVMTSIFPKKMTEPSPGPEGSVHIAHDPGPLLIALTKQRSSTMRIETNINNVDLTIAIVDRYKLIIKPSSLLSISDEFYNGDLGIVSSELEILTDDRDYNQRNTTTINLTQGFMAEAELMRIIDDNGDTTRTTIVTGTSSDGTKTIDAQTTTPKGGIYKCPNTSYIPITTASALRVIKLTRDYCLVNDITITWSFNPIKTFSGTLDGQKNKIIGLNIDKPTSTQYVGLFTTIAVGGKVKNLIIENPIVKGNSFVGVITGLNHGTIEAVRIEGTSGSVTGNKNIGGIAGLNLSGGIITNSYANVNVSGLVEDVGGLVGHNGGGAIVERSYSSGSVTGIGVAKNIGGLVGANYNLSYMDDDPALVKDCYANGAVTGNEGIGGLIGYNDETGSVQNSYSTGNVTGTGTGNQVGGLIGHNEHSSTITNSYFDTAGTGMTAGIGEDDNNQNENVTGITTSEITGGGEEPFKEAGWNFTYLWFAKGDGNWPEFISEQQQEQQQ